MARIRVHTVDKAQGTPPVAQPVRDWTTEKLPSPDGYRAIKYIPHLLFPILLLEEGGVMGTVDPL